MSLTIAPSLLSCNFLELGKEISQLESADNLWLHLDVMDSHFVPNLTFGAPVLKKLKTITKHKLDAHFMVTNPEFFVENFRDVGLHNFTYHWEVTNDHDRLIRLIKKNYPSVGISLNPSTPITAVPESLFGLVDVVLIMSVNPGFGGQKFIESSVDKVKELSLFKKNHKLHFAIQVDGGVNEITAKRLKEAGATNLVAGSYIFEEKNKDYLSQIDKLRHS